jgi:antirestriction protein ArdC
MPEKFDVAQVATDAIIARLEEGVIPWRRPWRATGDGLARNLRTKRPYTGVNALLLPAMGFGSPWWLTVRQANDLGGAVRKGERSTPVVFWKRMERALRADEDAPANARVVTDETGRRRLQWFMLRYYRVFNVEQCDGLEDRVPAPEPNEWDADAAAVALDEALCAFCDREGIRLSHSGDRAFYHPARDRIALPDVEAFDSGESYVRTFAHEAIHATGHKSRLAREDILAAGGMGSESYSREELTAELGAAMLALRFGCSTDGDLDNAAAYIGSWLRALRGDRRLVVAAASRAQRAAEYIVPLDDFEAAENDADGAAAAAETAV